MQHLKYIEGIIKSFLQLLIAVITIILVPVAWTIVPLVVIWDLANTEANKLYRWMAEDDEKNGTDKS